MAKTSKGKKKATKASGNDPVVETPVLEAPTEATENTGMPVVVEPVAKPVLKLSESDGVYVKVPLHGILSNVGQSRGMGLLPNLRAEGWRAFPNDPSPGKTDNGKVVMLELLSGDPTRQKAMVALLDEKEKTLRDLVISLGINGQIQPIVIRPIFNDKGEVIEGEFNVSAGARRTISQAMRYAESGGTVPPFIDASLMGKQTAAEELGRSLDENRARLNQSPIDDALFYRDLKRVHNMTVKQIAKAVLGKEEAYQVVQQRIQLLSGTKEEIQRCHEGKLGSSVLLKAIVKRNAGTVADAPDKPGVGERAKVPSVAQVKELLLATSPTELKDDTKDRFGKGKVWGLISTSADVRELLSIFAQVPFQTIEQVLAGRDKARKEGLAAAAEAAKAKQSAE